ncbi:MAG: SDR family oxidoreductase [Anaerolineae bacterium]
MPVPLRDQVVVITGASSGIGRETAIQFGKAGAKVVIAARNHEALAQVAEILRENGAEVLVVPTDVGVAEQMLHLAEATIERFGRIDTWVNNAGISLYATVEETTPDEVQQIMQTNYMGMVHGVNAALPYMKRQGSGTLINVGSVESQVALPLQAAYAASKHAVKGYTDALRLEQLHEKTGVNIILVMPSGINTPLFNHARSKMGVKPMPIAPAYPPELAARSIVNAAQNTQRDVYVGGSGWFFWLIKRLSPSLLDRILITNGAAFRMQTSSEPDNERDNMYQPLPGTGRVHGDFPQLTKPSLYTPLLEWTPRWLRSAVMVLVPTAVMTLITRKRKQEKKKRNWWQRLMRAL